MKLTIPLICSCRFSATLLSLVLLSLLGSLPAFGKTVLCVGDSITWGHQNDVPYPSRLQALLGGGSTVINEGLPGEFSFEAKDRLPGLLNQYNPTHVLILYGTNDSTFFQPGEATVSYLQEMVQQVREKGAIAIVGTIPPHIGPRASRTPVVNDLNARIRWNRAPGGYLVADLHRRFDPAAPYMQSDGFHPNDAGAQLLAESFWNLIVLSDQFGTSPQWSSALQTWLYPQDNGWRWSYDYMNIVPDVGNQFAYSTLLGFVFTGDANGFLHSTRLGWMNIEQQGDRSYIWSIDWNTWLDVWFGEKLYSYDYGGLQIVDGLDAYQSDLFGSAVMGSYGGWLYTNRFGWTWAARNPGMTWFYTEAEGWLKIDPNGSGYFWSFNRNLWLPPS